MLSRISPFQWKMWQIELPFDIEPLGEIRQSLLIRRLFAFKLIARCDKSFSHLLHISRQGILVVRRVSLLIGRWAEVHLTEELLAKVLWAFEQNKHFSLIWFTDKCSFVPLRWKNNVRRMEIVLSLLQISNETKQRVIGGKQYSLISGANRRWVKWQCHSIIHNFPHFLREEFDMKMSFFLVD